MTTNAQLALETARSVENSALRHLAVVNVLTRSGAFDGHAIRTLCHAEVRSKALRAQCDYAQGAEAQACLESLQQITRGSTL